MKDAENLISSSNPGTPSSGRRKALALLGASAFLAGLPSRSARAKSPQPVCIATPQQTEGPYFLDHRLERSDIRSDGEEGAVSQGIPLSLQLRLLNAEAACRPMSGVIVEVWHCNAKGEYSGVQGRRSGKNGSSFLRGYQVSDEEGHVQFLTIYPGWYPGRAVHVHVKLRWPSDSPARVNREWASQLYFDDAITDRVHATAPYRLPEVRRTRNQDDFLFRKNGNNLQVELNRVADGYSGQFDIVVRGA